MYPIPRREADRLDCLHELGILFSDPSGPFDQVCDMVAAQFRVSGAYISFVDSSMQWLKASVGVDLTCTKRDIAFCAHTIMSDEVLVIEDAQADDRFAANPLVVGEPRIRFYAGAPIVYAPELRLGSVCVVDRNPRSFSAAERRMLASYAAIVVSQLRLLTAARLVRRGFEDRARLESEIALLTRAVG